jgi:hypothetical protein
MPIDLQIGSEDSLSAIEAKMEKMQAAARARGVSPMFQARLSTDRKKQNLLKDIWASMAVASGMARSDQTELIAWGIQDWSGQEGEDGFALSPPSLVAMQRGARVVSDAKPRREVDTAVIKRLITRLGGEIGTGGRQRTIVELDPDYPTASPFTTGSGRRNAFFEFCRRVLSALEIGAGARKAVDGTGRESTAKGTILEFLYELHSNASDHARTESGVRFLRLQKHQFPHRDGALARVPDFPELERYLKAQPERPSARVFNIVEASISDFGPGIVDGFLSTFAGRGYGHLDRAELLQKLLHEQLSSKSGDPNSGLGIGEALSAAQVLNAFVSLRTAEFWLTMPGAMNGAPRLTFRAGPFPTIPGTHWQLLMPDSTEIRLSTSASA